MHRSGTSALTRALGLLGAALPRAPIAPAPSNEPGFWEPASIVDLHDQLLTSAGTSWDDIRPFPRPWFTSSVARTYAERLAALVTDEFGNAPLAVLKDPRLCRLMPLWRDVLRLVPAQPVIIVAVRHPAEVAASLAARDGLSFARSMLLWLDHILAAERDSRGLPRAIVHYDQLIETPEEVLRHLAVTLDLPQPTAPLNAGTPGLPLPEYRHHQASQALSELGGTLGDWVERLYGCLQGKTRFDDETETACDAVRSEMEAAMHYFLPLQDESATQLAAQRAHLSEEVHIHKREHARLLELLAHRERQHDAEAAAKKDSETAHLQTALAVQATELRRLLAVCAGQRSETQRLKSIRFRVRSLLHSLKTILTCPPRFRRVARLIRSSGLFNEAWYHEAYPDVAAAAVDPVLHYVRFGVNEGRRPNSWFDAAGYVSRHPQLTAKGINPLAHCVGGHDSSEPRS